MIFFKSASSSGGGASAPTITPISSNVTLAQNSINFVDTSSARTLALPDPAATFTGTITVKDAVGSANANNITITRFAAESIEGVAASKILSTDWGSWTFVSNGTNWFLI